MVKQVTLSLCYVKELGRMSGGNGVSVLTNDIPGENSAIESGDAWIGPPMIHVRRNGVPLY